MNNVAAAAPKKLDQAKRRGRPPQALGPALDRTRLVFTMLEMAREGGMDSLNIRPVAKRLGVSPRLIYHHVQDKDEMLCLLTDAILRGRLPDLSDSDWQSRLRSLARAVRLAYRDFPGSAAFILAHTPNDLSQPNALAFREAVTAALKDAGLTERQCEEMRIVFSVVVLGGVVLAESRRDDHPGMGLPQDVIEAASERATDVMIAGVLAAVPER